MAAGGLACSGPGPSLFIWALQCVHTYIVKSIPFPYYIYRHIHTVHAMPGHARPYPKPTVQQPQKKVVGRSESGIDATFQFVATEFKKQGPDALEAKAQAPTLCLEAHGTK